ncbi:MAG: hypothetical protein AAGI14_13355 [Pseudomonadota bacterium]
MIEESFLTRSPEQCWICEDTKHTLTSEHKFKASALRAIFGRSTMLMRKGMSLQGERYWKKIQGPKSGHVKFTPSICDNCNNNLTQKHDFAVSEFLGFFLNTKEGFITFTLPDQIKGINYSVQWFCHTMRYFSKHLGCVIIDSDFPVPRKLSAFIREDISEIPMSLEVSMNSDRISKLTDSFGDVHDYIGHTGLLTSVKKSTRKLEFYETTLQTNKFDFRYRYEFDDQEIDEISDKYKSWISEFLREQESLSQ